MGMMWFVPWALLLTTVDCYGHGIPFPDKFTGHEKQLYLNITSGYSPLSRPVRNASTPIRLTFGVSLKQILDLTWEDENIGWRPRDFNNLDRIMFPATRLWVPDIYIFNVAGSALDGFINVSGSYVVVAHDGRVEWTVPILIESACPVDATYFPYDKQSCEIIFGSWIHDISQIDIGIGLAAPDLSQYVVNNEFDIDSTSLERVIVDGSCCPGSGSHPMVRMKIHLRRKTIYYDYIVIAPTINLCILTLATFLLPCECGWKVAIGLTVFLTLYVLQLLIAENVPDTNSTPLIGVFLLLVMSLNCVSLITATLVMNIKRRGQYERVPKVSPLLLYVCEKYLSRLTCTKIADWKRVAVNISTDGKLKSLDNRELLVDANAFMAPDACAEKRDGQNQYMQLCDLSPVDCNRSELCMQRNVTAESSFSGTSTVDKIPENGLCMDTFLGDIDTRKICTVRHENKRPVESNVNMSFSPGDECNDDVFISGKPQCNHDHSDNELVDPSWTQLRKRPSYRRAISTGSVFNEKETHGHHRTLRKTKSEFSNLKMKYQWYFVADVIDTTAFIAYIILMFIGILTVLVIVPLYA